MDYKSIFLSDPHLGATIDKADLTRNFLENSYSDNLFLLGDIVDVLELKMQWHWPEANNQLLQTMIKCAEDRKVVYIPGNHDAIFREFAGFNFGKMSIELETYYTALNGKTFWLLHGDRFDSLVKNKFLSWLGVWGYDFIGNFDNFFNKIRKLFGYKKYFSLSSFLKKKVQNAPSYIAAFERCLVKVAKDKGVHGVICGHLHLAEDKILDGIQYYNDGDMIDTFTVLVEHLDGNFEILDLSANI